MHDHLCPVLKGEICSDDRHDIMICFGLIAMRNTWEGNCTDKGRWTELETQRALRLEFDTLGGQRVFWAPLIALYQKKEWR